LIGVKDNGVIIGVESEEEKYMIEYAAESFCKPIISFEMVEWEFEGKTVLQVIIDKSNIQPHYSKDENGKWLVYIRQYDENILADKVYVEVLKRQNKDNKSQIKYSFAESQLIEYLSNNQKITFKEFCKIGKVPPYVAERILVNMIGMGIINIIHSVNGAHFTLGTIL
ncbi:MAG: ATP-binding protein, partial [Bacteroidota bacterium]|nr:ATP-binding protein [Bacteroidota bacterium]